MTTNWNPPMKWSMLIVQSWHLVDWIYDEVVWVWSPSLADILVRREAFKRFEPSCKIVRCDMDAQLLMIIVLIALDCGVIDCSAHLLDLTISPWMVGFGQPMLKSVCVTDHVKTHRPRMYCVSISGLLGELDAVVRQNCVQLVWNGFQHGL